MASSNYPPRLPSSTILHVPAFSAVPAIAELRYGVAGPSMLALESGRPPAFPAAALPYASLSIRALGHYLLLLFFSARSFSTHVSNPSRYPMAPPMIIPPVMSVMLSFLLVLAPAQHRGVQFSAAMKAAYMLRWFGHYFLLGRFARSLPNVSFGFVIITPHRRQTNISLPL